MFLLLHQLHHILPITGATSAAAAVRCLVEYRRRIPIGEMMDMVNRSDQSGSNCSSNSVKMEHGGRVWRFLGGGGGGGGGGCLGGGVGAADDVIGGDLTVSRGFCSSADRAQNGFKMTMEGSSSSSCPDEITMAVPIGAARAALSSSSSSARNCSVVRSSSGRLAAALLRRRVAPGVPLLLVLLSILSRRWM